MSKDNIFGVIYKITNIQNGKIYIGQTSRKNGFNGRYERRGIGIERVYNFYISKQKSGEQINLHLMNSIKKYGFDSFVVEEQFDIAYTQEELYEKERIYIEKYKTTEYEHGYNQKEGGKNGKANERLRKKLSLVHKGKKSNRRGISLSEETKRKISISKTNPSKKTRDKISKAQFGELNNNAVKITCVTTKEHFNCASDAARKYNIDRSSIIKCCKKKRKSAGKHPETGEKLVWEYREM